MGRFRNDYLPTSEARILSITSFFISTRKQTCPGTTRKQHLLVECARISAGVLREDDKALNCLVRRFEEQGVLRNADLKCMQMLQLVVVKPDWI